MSFLNFNRQQAVQSNPTIRNDAVGTEQVDSSREDFENDLGDEYGIRILYDPEAPTADVVFIHGVTGKQISTWTANGADKPWPKLLLPREIPEARISAFGYDADVIKKSGAVSSNRIGHHAHNLLADLADMRLRHDTTELPIIFVAHSLGGLVCEKMLTVSNIAEPYQKKILQCTRAIAFLGTPHRGSSLASLAVIAGNMAAVVKEVNTSILETLTPTSEVLENINQEFHTLLKSREQSNLGAINITCFAEELAMKMGKTFHVVPQQSAILARYPFKTIHGDHSSMTKFAIRTSGYWKIANELKRWIGELNQQQAVLDHKDHALIDDLLVTVPSLDRARIENQRDRVLAGSCSWVLRDRAYTDWQSTDTDSSRVLWIHGDPGKGKTMLAISLIDTLGDAIARFRGPEQQRTLLTYFFCDTNDSSRNTVLSAVKNLLYQILSHEPDLVVSIRKEYRTQRSLLTSSLDALWISLCEILEKARVQKICYIIDALDECDPSSQEAFLRLLTTSIRSDRGSRQLRKVKWLVTSRNERIPQQYLARFSNIDLELNHLEVSRNVAEFINVKVAELADLKGYDCDMRRIVEEDLHRRVEGTFLWAALVCRELRKADVQAINVKQTLRRLPSGLTSLYGRIMEQVNESEDRELAAFAKKILQSVAIALRPLSLKELAVTANLPFENRSNSKTLVQYVHQCGSFLTVRDEIVYFIHGSARNYLRSANAGLFSTGLDTAHRTVTINLLNYLCGIEFSQKREDISMKDAETVSRPDSQLEYPVLYWMDHGRHWSSDVAPHMNLKGEFFQRRSRLRDSWFNLYWAKRHHDAAKPDGFTLLHLIAYSGLSWLAAETPATERLADVNTPDSLGALPLHWASRQGHTGLVIRMIESIANINLADKDGSPALHWAIRGEHEAVVRHLLQSGANIDIKGNTLVWPALHLAALIPDVTILCLLIHHGADITTKDTSGHTALYWALQTRNIPAARILVEKGADVEERAYAGDTLLAVVASGAPNSEVKFLLEVGADHTAENEKGMTPLHHAASSPKSEETIALLLRKGADVAAKDVDGRTPLHYAAENGLENIVELLLRNGADRATGDRNGRTVLHAAAAAGQEAVIEFLLNEGVDIGVECQKAGATALCLAARSGSITSVQTLLAKGADVWSIDKSGKTVLHWAAESWRTDKTGTTVLHWAPESWIRRPENDLVWPLVPTAASMAEMTEMVQLLLRAGADATSQDREGCTALHIAASFGNEAVVRALMEIKSLIITQDRNRHTPLHHALFSSQGAITKILLDNGAWELLSTNGMNRLILHMMAFFDSAPIADSLTGKDGPEYLVKLLIEKGADIRERDAQGWTALNIAVHERKETLIQTFLKFWPDEDQAGMLLHPVIRNGEDREWKRLLANEVDVGKRDSEGKTALHWAAIMGRERATRDLLDVGSVVSEKDDKERTALHWASSMKHDDVVQLLLEWRSNISATDQAGRTALHSATTRWGSKSTVELLLSHGADVMATDRWGSTALHLATQCGDRFAAQSLLERGAKVSEQDISGRTALHLATVSGPSEMVKLLIEAGGRVNAQELNTGRTPLHLAQTHSDLIVVRQLLESGADVSRRDKDGRTALHLAAAQEDIDKVRILLEKGADVTLKDNEGATAIKTSLLGDCHPITQLLIEKAPPDIGQHIDGTELGLAASLGRKEIARLLILKGADVAAEYQPGQQPLHWAAIGNHDEVAELLLDNGADISARADYGFTPLHFSVHFDNRKMSRLLLAKGADVTAKNDQGRQPLHYATIANEEDAVSLLLEHGANISARDDLGCTPLHLAILMYSEKRMVQLLLSRGADIAAKDNRLGWNALHWAGYRGEEEFVQLLLEKGADVEAKDKNGKTAMDLAISADQQAVVKILMENATNTITGGQSLGSETPELAVTRSRRWRNLFRAATRRS